MSRAKHIMRFAAKAMAGVAILAVLGFVEYRGGSTPVRDIKVHLQAADDVRFIDAEAVKEAVLGTSGTVIGTPIGRVDETGIEQHLRSIPCIADADVYHTMDGVLHVKATQRVPLVRVVNADGSGFYIDREGWTMPLDPAYTPRVMVVTGQLMEPFSACAPVNVLNGPDSLVGHSPCRAIHALAATLDQDPLWRALFTQVVVDAGGSFTLIPGVGMTQVRIGDGSHLDERLAKLKLFYEQGIPQTDWRRYRTVDLRFDGQVVCAKRTSER